MWTFHGYGRYSNGRSEVNEIAPGLFQARLIRTHRGMSDLVDSTNYGKPSEAQAAADRMAASETYEAWTRGYGAPAHDPDPITEAPEIAANHGLFAESGGAYGE